ncbi:MAG: hypothetical protein AABW71_03645 [Nanoarchaeota archaeon]
MTYTTIGKDGWEYVFFDSGNGLTMDEKTVIADNVVWCYQKGHRQRDLHLDTFEARITRGKRGMLGVFTGTAYSAEVVPNPIDGTERQKTDLALLVLDRIDPSRN